MRKAQKIFFVLVISALLVLGAGFSGCLGEEDDDGEGDADGDDNGDDDGDDDGEGDDDGDDDDGDGALFASVTIHERGTHEDPTEDNGGELTYVELGITIDPPSTDLEEVEVVLYDEVEVIVAELDDDEERWENNYRLRWTDLDGDEVTNSSRLWVEHRDDDYDFDGYKAEMTIEDGGTGVWLL